MTTSVTESTRVQGRCLVMCPSSEIHFRRSNGMIHILEKPDNGRNRKMVKEYARPAAGRDHLYLDCLRPPNVLIGTVQYLLRLYDEEKDTRFSLVYSFVCDRLRAVRQDMILQDVSPTDTVRILEKMIPFYFESGYACRTGDCSTYDWKLHLNSLDESLSRWHEAVPHVSKHLIDSRIVCGYILHQIPAHSALIDIYKWKDFLTSDLFGILREIVISYHCNNYVRFFRKLLQLPSDHLAVAAVDAVSALRQRSLFTICSAYKSNNLKIPISAVSNWLHYCDGCDLFDLLSQCSVAQADSILVSSLNLSGLQTRESSKLLAKL